LSSTKNLSAGRPRANPRFRRPAVTAPPPAKATGSASYLPTRRASPTAERKLVQGSKHLLAVPGPSYSDSPGRFLLKSMTFRRCYPPEGSLTCVHREDVSRYRPERCLTTSGLCPIRRPPKWATTGLTSSR
jgi:hypothetical protein